ncbi:MAG: MFS transporter [Caldilineaceae bacterium]
MSTARPFDRQCGGQGPQSCLFGAGGAALVGGVCGQPAGGRLPLFFADLWGLTTDAALVYRYPLLLAGVLMLPGLFLMYAAEDVDPRLVERVTAGDAAGDAPAPSAVIGAAPVIFLVMLVVVRAFHVSGVATTSTFFNVYLDTALNVSTTQIGILSALGRLVGVAAALLLPRLAARWGNLNVVVWACLGTALSFIPLAFFPNWLAAGAGFIGVVGLAALRYPAFMVYAMDQVAPEQRGLMAGSGEMAGGLIFAVIALGGGYWIGAYGFQTLFLLAGVLSAIGGFLFWVYFRSYRQAGAASAQPVKG